MELSGNKKSPRLRFKKETRNSWKIAAFAAGTLFFLFYVNYAKAQQQYFQINTRKEKNTYTNSIQTIGALNIVAPRDQYGAITLDYPGKTPHQLYTSVMNYLKATQRFVVIANGDDATVKYRDFFYIGKKDSCKADLIALNYITIYTLENKIKFSLDEYNIFSTVNDAQLEISKFGEVSSRQDVPFNYYEYVQPAPYKDAAQYRTGGLVGLATRKAGKKHQPGLAYPESIYDPEGNIVNAANKRIIEVFFNSYIISLKNYLDNNLK
ncbi:hypothetical protein A8C56_14690 [Niabella ginsenosidivorans]|uniref:Uncharacterized protein n=1 Tax=Niabella ginsenosidivorans TaxID=1176587 RepID=A0A1A9I5T2_9BACT|nr:hypothetical protein [Niabella ginsenosidivorans]ANH82051.1 hypothetical protein A8C56_14690 [Niabella ginsenosidivorans]